MAEDASRDAPATEEDVQKQLEDIEYTGHKHGPRLAIVVSFICVAWSLFQLWIASPLPFTLNFGIIVDVPARGIHLAFGLLLAYLMFPAARRFTSDRIPWYDLILAILASGAALYLFLGYQGLVSRQGVLLEVDMLGMTVPIAAILGGIGIVLPVSYTHLTLPTKRIV